MKFEDRLGVILEMLTGEGLVGYTPPRGMSEDDQVAITHRIAEALDRKLPVMLEPEFRGKLSETFRAVHDAHEGYAWPTQAEFVKGLPIYGLTTGRAPETFAPKNQHAVAAKKMAAGQPVPESCVWGRASKQMLNEGDVSRDVMDRYRNASLRAYERVYRGKAIEILHRNYGEVVSEFIAGAAT